MMNDQSESRAWIEAFRAQTAPVVGEPFWACLADAVAIVESAHGHKTMRGPEGFNEIGYKAIPGHPACRAATREAADAGAAGGPERLEHCEARFRLFADRAEQARSLRYLWRTSSYYESARLLFVLAFYCAYAPGREAGARALIDVFNQVAASGAHEGVRPFELTRRARARGDAASGDPEVRALNHAAARRAVMLFATLTRQQSTSD